MMKWRATAMLLLSLTLLLSTSLHLSLRPRAAAARAPHVLRRRPSRAHHVPRSSSSTLLSRLFATPNFNFTHQTSNLLWNHMWDLLSRPDALRAAAGGAHEASAAWKSLVSSLLSEKDPSFEPSRNVSCPYSVAGNESEMEIPCGLVEDSAVTLIGVPIEKNGSFRFGIELIGSKARDLSDGEGERERPIVFALNVSLDSHGPVMEQSYWTEESGLGGLERCPGLVKSSSDGDRVDGLVRCNQQLGESIVPEASNGSRPDNPIAQKKPRSGAHLSAGFPFAAGHPFTATLWAGPEGFHLTVNGRHETSFRYREKLEPWTVTKVRGAGDLYLLSMLANGLPVYEDSDFVKDRDLLKAPQILPNKEITLLIGVFSTVNNFKRRMAIRRSWMQYDAVRSADVAVQFFTGLHKNDNVNLELWREAEIYGDIQIMPFVDYYSLITLKTVAICIFGTEIITAKYIMKTDDDTFVRIDEVIQILNQSDSNGLLYGLISFQSSPHRDRDSKWFISHEEWASESYPPWAHGPGYVISGDIAEFIVQGHQERTLQLFKLEDVAMGIWIQEYKTSGKDVNYVNDERFHNEGCESNYVIAHYQSPRLLLCLWEKLQKEKQAFCCE